MKSTANPLETLSQLWASGQRPNLGDFVRDFGPLPVKQLAALVRLDQRRRWQLPVPPECDSSSATFKYAAPAGVPVETYLQQFPEIGADAELSVELIVNEILIREELGQRPSIDEYAARFPKHAFAVKLLIEQRRAAPAENTATDGKTVAAPPNAPPSPLPEVFGRYRVKKKLGEGGMGAVYLAEDSQLQRQVAIKVPLFDGSDGPMMIERFYREARIAATFHHPNICPVYDVGEIEGTHFLTMPFLAGETMSAWLKRSGPLPQARACRLASRIAEAIQVAHQAGVLHRDLKPANIMLPEGQGRGEPEPVVMDFGLARRGRDRDPQLTEQGAMIGTGEFMPPEQIVGDSTRIGPAADVYSLGVILYQMLTGRKPFGGSITDVMRGVLSQAPPPPRRIRPEIDPALEAICLKALAKEPADRFPSMAEFAAALAPFWTEASAASDQRPPVAATTPRLRKKSNAGLLVGVLGVAAILIGVAIWAFVLPRFATPEPDKNDPEFALALANGKGGDKPEVKKPDEEKKPEVKIEKKPDEEKKPEVKIEKKPDEEKKPEVKIEKKPEPSDKPAMRLALKGHTGAVRSVAFNPKDGNQLVSGGEDRLVRIWDIAADKHESFKGNPGPILSVAFSPTGKHIASAGGDAARPAWDVILWEVPGCKIVASFKGHSSHVTCVAFSRDGKMLASAASDNTIALWNVDNPRDKGKTLLGDQAFNAVAFHPKANMLASGGADDTVRLWDLATGNPRTLEERPALTVAFSPDGRTLAAASEVDNFIKLWDTTSGRNTATLEGHRGVVRSLAFNDDGTQLVSGSADRTVKLWDVAAAKNTDTLQKHQGEVYAVAFSPDGRTVASGSQDQTIILWNIPEAKK